MSNPFFPCTKIFKESKKKVFGVVEPTEEFLNPTPNSKNPPPLFSQKRGVWGLSVSTHIFTRCICVSVGSKTSGKKKTKTCWKKRRRRRGQTCVTIYETHRHCCYCPDRRVKNFFPLKFFDHKTLFLLPRPVAVRLW